LTRLGLGEAYRVGRGTVPPGLETTVPPVAGFGAARETSPGKDTPSGHWEIAGVPVPFDWGYFPRQVPAFPPAMIAALIEEAELPGILGDCHASGTEIIAALGEEHLRTGKPICYTSADSVFQIAAHEEQFGLGRLYAAALEAFDRRIPSLLARLDGDDLLIVTADHCCDPSFAGTDHMREMVPVLALGRGLEGRSLGIRSSFADIGASIARHLGLPPPGAGESFV
jgi:phosphopentomutase